MDGAAGAGGVLSWLEATSLSQAMRGNLWLYPAVEIVHIVGFVILVGAIAMFDVRLLGWSKSLPVQQLGRHLLPWSMGSLALVVPAGLMMFSAHPHDFVGNTVFLLKLGLITGAGLNALVFHIGAYRSVASWDAHTSPPFKAKFHAVLSLVIWVSVICCGRLLAYT